MSSQKAPRKPVTKPEPTGQFLSVEDLAARWGVSQMHVRRMNYAGELPQPMRLGKLLRWSLNAITQWEESQG